VSAAPVLDGVLEAALYVDDLAAARTFYGALLGLAVIAEVPDRHVFFRCGATVVLTFRAEETRQVRPHARLPVPPHGATGPGHICFAVDAAELDDVAAHLRRRGIAIEADFCWPNGARSIYVRDPAGNSVEFAEPKLWSAAA
jgi:catechol 2,3-dioxygenase-like lactoylglutathione lyase family enzyme